MSRRKSLALGALVAAATAIVPAGSAGAQICEDRDCLSKRLANVPFQTTKRISAPFPVDRSFITVFYRCTSREGGRVKVGPTEQFSVGESFIADCDGRTHRIRVEMDPDDLLAFVTLTQDTAARAGFTVWR
jgi:hypothetical protein